MTDAAPEIVAVNLSRRIVLTSDGRVLRMETLLDEDGLTTDLPSCAVAAVAGAGGEWYAVLLSEFSDRAVFH